MKEFIRTYSIVRKGVTYTVELRIDIEAIAIVMVNNAAKNSSGKATTMHGSISAKVIK